MIEKLETRGERETTRLAEVCRGRKGPSADKITGIKKGEVQAALRRVELG